MKTILTVFCMILIANTMVAQDKVLDLWTNGSPSDNGLTGPEVDLGNNRVDNISVAKMYIYLPDKKINTGAAVVFLPGGGYFREAMSHEGYEVGEWLKDKGIAGIILKYRLPNGHPQIPLEDASHAIRFVRQHAKEWGIDPHKIGIGGASAGGHLASTAGTLFDSGDSTSGDLVDTFSSQPDFMLLLYPFIYFEEGKIHPVLAKVFFGGDTSWETVKRYSSDLNVTAQTPPTFIVLADDDKVVGSKHAIRFFQALKQFNIPSEMHIFQTGGHGFGMTKQGLPVDHWPDLFYDWLQLIKILE